MLRGKKAQCNSWMSHACEHKDVPVISFVLVEKAQQLKLGVAEAIKELPHSTASYSVDRNLEAHA